MGQLNKGVNLFQLGQAGSTTNKIALTNEAPSTDGFSTATHYIQKTSEETGIFVYLNFSAVVYQSTDGTTWTEYGRISDVTSFEGHNIPWDGDAEYMHFTSELIQPDGSVSIRCIPATGPMVFDSTPVSIDETTDALMNADTTILIPVVVSESEGGTATLEDYLSTNQSTFLGASAGESQITGINPKTGLEQPESENIGIGYQALQDTTSGTNNVAIGSNSLSENTTGFNNVAISKGALGDYLLNNTTIGIGFDAGKPIENGAAIDGHIGNTLMGHETFNAFNIKDTAEISNNTAIGLRALKGIGGTDTASPKLNNVKNNTAIGRQAGNSIVHTSGGALNHNTFLGNSAGMNAVPQQGNMMSNLLLGARAGMGGYIGSNNVILQNATADTTLGNANWGVSGNIAIGGNAALYSDNNVIIGNGADSAPNTIGASDIDDETKGENQSGNMILAGSGNTISNIGGKKVQTNSILSGTNITIGGAIESKDNFVANSSGITLNGTSNILLGTELTTDDSTQLVKGNRLTIINSSSYMLADGANDVTLIGSKDISAANGCNENMILESKDITMSGDAKNSVVIQSEETNLVSSQRTVAILDDSSTISGSAFDTLLLNTNSHSINARGNTFIGGTSNTVVSNSENNVFIGGSSTSTASGADNNILLGATSTSDIGGSNNIISGTTHTAIGEYVKWSFIAGSKHTLSPIANSQRNIIVGFENTVTSGNNSFIGGTKGDINESNSFGYGKGIQLEHGNMAGFGKFNDGAANDGADALFTVGCGFNENAGRRNAINVVSAIVDETNNKAVVYLDQLVDFNFTDDADAEAKGIGVGGLYHTDGIVKIRRA